MRVFTEPSTHDGHHFSWLVFQILRSRGERPWAGSPLAVRPLATSDAIARQLALLLRAACKR